MSPPHRPGRPERDPALDAAWKAHSTELPPPRLSAAILAAAHREARTRPHAVGDDDGLAHARGPSRAWWGLAAAATIGAIAFGLLQLTPPPGTDQAATVATDVPRAVPERAPPADASRDAPPPLTEAQRLPGADAPPRADAPAASREIDRRAALARAPDPTPSAAPRPSAQKAAVPRPFPGGAPAPSVAVAPAPPSAPATTPPDALAKSEAASNAVDARRRQPGERMAATVPTQPAAQAARRTQADRAAQGMAAAPVGKLQASTPAAWIERISTLHAEQRFDDAARELNLFRDAYPDADTRLPLALQAWAASVKRN